jgi:mono/diheme cytochrome c family protein
MRGFACALALPALLALPAAGQSAGATAPDAVTPNAWGRGWAVLRAMDCARCHGRDYDGFAAPSLIAAVRDGSRERFERIVLDGEITRGMPGYRSQPPVVAELDAIYAYLLARAEGRLGTGDPARASRRAAPR